MGALVGYGLLVTLALGLALRGRARIVLLATAGLLTLPLAFSLSRGAWIATACSVLVMLIAFNWRVAAATVASGVLALAVVTVVAGHGPAAGERLTSIASTGSEPDRSVRDRYALWATAVGIWADHPVLGVGMKDFVEYRDRYSPMSLSGGSDVDDPQHGFRREPLLSAHNQYLMVLSEQGIVGALAFGGVLVTLAASALRRRKTPSTDALPRFFDVVAPGILVWTLIDFMYGDVGAGPTGVLLGVLLGLVARRRAIVPCGRTS
jgi:O-antigen ligase